MFFWKLILFSMSPLKCKLFAILWEKEQQIPLAHPGLLVIHLEGFVLASATWDQEVSMLAGY